MHVEVAICTWNRAHLLDQTLASMRELLIPPGVEWELIVVNNHSTDETDDVIERHAAHLPIRRIWEPTLGKSAALNTAIRELRGDLVLWTDDDVLVDRHWLAGHASAAERYPQAAFFGAPILPWFEVDPPKWTTDAWHRVSTMYAAREFGDETFLIDNTTLPFGANWSIRTEVQRQYPYDCRLGRVGPNDVRGEETAVLHSLTGDGHKGYWIPQAKLRHFIPAERLTLDYVRRFYFGIGQTAALVEGNHSLSRARRRLRRAHYRAKVALYETQYRLYRHIASPSLWIKKLKSASHYAGRLACFAESVNVASQQPNESPQSTTHEKRAA